MKRIKTERDPILTLKPGLVFGLTRHNFIGHIIVEVESNVDGSVRVNNPTDRLVLRWLSSAFVGEADRLRCISPAGIVENPVNGG